MPACADRCPICKTALADQCCETCGSLEGVDEDSFATSRVFGYDWAAGSVAPWRDAQGRAYATPSELAEDALAAAGIENGGYIIDLGCGDAAILRAAATRFGCRGLGLDIDDGALADAARAIEADGVGELVSVRRGDLNEFDLAGEIDQANAPVVVTCYLLPATLRELRPKLEDACRRGATVVLFRWDCGLAWQGPEGRHDDRGFTVYCPGEGSDTDETEPDSELLDRLSPLVEVLGVEALQYLDTASLGCLNACARAFGKQSEATGRSPCEDEAYRRLRAHPKFRRHDGKMPEPSIHRPARGGGFPGWIYVLNDWERYWVFKARGEFRGYVGVPADACEFAFDKKGRPTLCHVLDLSGSTQRIANCPTPLSSGLPHEYISPTSDEFPTRSPDFAYSPPSNPKCDEAFAPSSRPQAWGGSSSNAAVKNDARRRSQKFRQQLDAASLWECAPAPAPKAAPSLDEVPRSRSSTSTERRRLEGRIFLRPEAKSDRRIASQVALERQFAMRDGDAGRELRAACERAEKQRQSIRREQEVEKRRRDKYIEVEDGLDVIRTNPLIDARKAAEEERLAANLRRQRDIQKQREETQLRLEKLSQPLRRPKSAPARRPISTAPAPARKRRPKTSRRKPRKSDLSTKRWREAEAEAQQYPLYGEKTVRCVRMRDPRTLAKQWDQQVRDGAIWWVGKPLENAPPPPGEPDPDNLWDCVGKRNPNAKMPSPVGRCPSTASVGLTDSEVRLARAFTNQNLVERLVPRKEFSPRSYMAGKA